jgi:hypothetical protein
LLLSDINAEVFLDKLIVVQLGKKFIVFINMFTRDRHTILS